MKFGSQGIASVPIEAAHGLFGFLMIEVNAIVSPIRPKAMPVILIVPAEVDRWLEADTPDALALKEALGAWDCRTGEN
jgi:putative SOS response-associated peptidase YedK